jgi:hypothetical protein
MMRTTAEGGFSTTNMVNFNSNSGNKLRSVKNYSPKNVYRLIKFREDNQSDNVEKSAKNEENTEQFEQNQNLSNNDLQQSA